MRVGATPAFIWTLWMLLLMFGVPATSSASVTRRDLALFRGLTLPNTTIVLSDAEVRQDERRYGLFYPVLFQLWFNHARTKAYVLWSASWTGGTLTFTKEGGHWQKPETSGWIT